MGRDHRSYEQEADRRGQRSANAIYSRYVRNASRIAAAKGEIWDPESIAKFSRKKVKSKEPITGFDDAEDELLVQARHEIEEETWELVSRRIVEKEGKSHTPEMISHPWVNHSIRLFTDPIEVGARDLGVQKADRHPLMPCRVMKCCDIGMAMYKVKFEARAPWKMSSWAER